MPHKLSHLNDAQQQAVSDRDRHLLIIAGPGSGKTHTLVQRIGAVLAGLPKNQKALAITFTQKAAQEIHERLCQHLEKKIDQVEAGTFHQFCLNVLREFSSLKDFRIATPLEIKKWMKQAWPGLCAKDLKSYREEVAQWKADPSSQASDRVRVYNAILREYKRLDFDDLLVEAVLLLKNDPVVLKKIQETYRFIFIDEYQDINPVQYELLRILVSKNNFLTAIGDPHQTIYGFRGSDPKVFEKFFDDFIPAHKVELQINYRSAANILEASHQVIDRGLDHLVSSAVVSIYQKGDLFFYEAMTDRSEAQYISRQVEHLVGGISLLSQHIESKGKTQDKPYSFGDIAILYRLNFQKKMIMQALDDRGIPYQSSQDQFLAEQKERASIIQDALELESKDISKILDLLIRSKDSFSDPTLDPLIDLAKKAKNFQDLADSFFMQRDIDIFSQKAEKVSLLTMHAAKGLEFSVVFIAGCEQGLIPFEHRDKKSDLEEERRLFYVAMTRAKEKLYLTRSCKRRLYGKMQKMSGSSFLRDIHQDLKTHDNKETVKQAKSEKQFDLF